VRLGRRNLLNLLNLSNLLLPLLGLLFFLAFWQLASMKIRVAFGSLPGPGAVYHEASNLWQEHLREREKATAFYARQQGMRQEFLQANPGQTWKERRYSGKPTYIDQIFTSLLTVFTGFLLASLVAVPIGILCGSSRPIHSALKPLIEVFKPVSPLAWLPIVMILVSALYNAPDPYFEKSFLSSAITVSLCSLWPTLINTAVGVASIPSDYLNVARVLKLGFLKRTIRIIIPYALPYIFTGLRLSLGVGWMVLIAAEMLAQNPGLGKFVWDMFQNGSSSTLAQIMVAVLTIGVIGVMLDRVMTSLQKLVSYDRVPVS